MPIFSVVVFFLLCYIIFCNNTTIVKFYNVFTLDCIIKLLFLQGYFLKIGNQEISNTGGICDIVLFIFSIFIIVRKKDFFYNKVFLLGIVFVAVSIVSIFYELVFPYDGMLLPKQDDQTNWDLYVVGKCTMYRYVPSITNYLISFKDLLIFTVFVIAFKMSFSIKLFLASYMQIIRYVKYIIIYGWGEFFIKNIIGNLTLTYEIADIMFGSNELSLVTEAFSRDGEFYALQGFCREPSHFNIVIFSVVMLMILGNFILKKVIQDKLYILQKTYNNFFIVMGLVLLLFTGGFSAVWLLFIVILSTVILILKKINLSIVNIVVKNYKLVMIMCFSSFFFYFIIMGNDYFAGRIQGAITVVTSLFTDNITYLVLLREENDGIGSTLARFISLYEGWFIFIDRPILGLGYKLQSVHGDTITYLVNMGLLGTFLFYKLLISSTKKVVYNKAFLGVLFVLGGVPMVISAYGFCAYWLLFIEGSMLCIHSKEWLG